MKEWTDLLLEPDGAWDSDELEGWFDAIAARLLNGTRLLVAGQPHRFTEVEFYYHGGGHLDPFTHKDPLQKDVGRWYFHKTRGTYRSGSFKGFDLTFGGPDAHGGVLIRGLEKPDGSLVDGPSLSVDHLLATTKASDVAVLDSMIAGRKAWEKGNPMLIEWLPELADRPLYSMARVGITLKRSRPGPSCPARYVMRPYRYLTEPRRIAKGKPLMVCGLHTQGLDLDRIREITGCTRGAAQAYVDEYEKGKQAPDFAPFRGAELSNNDLCRLYGTWYGVYRK
jgi:hypothetical protein